MKPSHAGKQIYKSHLTNSTGTPRGQLGGKSACKLSPSPRAPSFVGYSSSSKSASTAKRSIKKANTTVEILLRRALWSMGARYRLHVVDLPGKPDIVFPIRRIAIFCDGDFWHDRAWAGQRQKIALGSNSAYWISKIEYNIVR